MVSKHRSEKCYVNSDKMRWMVDEANEMLKKFFLKLVILHFCFCCQTSYFQKNQDIIKNEFTEEKINKCGIGWDNDWL